MCVYVCGEGSLGVRACVCMYVCQYVCIMYSEERLLLCYTHHSELMCCVCVIVALCNFCYFILVCHLGHLQFGTSTCCLVFTYVSVLVEYTYALYIIK